MENKSDLRGLLYRSDAQGIDIKTKLPSDFTSVIVKARRSNTEAGITSILYYFRGKYIHYVEGSNEAVIQLLKDVQADDRHDNIEVIFDQPVKRRYVEGSPLKLSSAEGEIHKGFGQFIFGVLQLDSLSIKNNADLLDELLSFKASVSDDANAVLKSQKKNVKPLVEKFDKEEGFSSYLLGISKWPTFTQEDVNNGLLQLCALLVSKQVPYRSLQASNPFAGDKELDAALYRLQSLSLLEMSYNENIQEENRSVKKGFFSKVQKFIKRLQQ